MVHPVHWRDGQSLAVKERQLLALVDRMASQGTVSLVGTSAGASLALLVFSQRSEKISRVVNVCGRLRAGQHRLRSLARMARTSPAFQQAVKAFELLEPQLTTAERQRVLTIRPWFGDQLVPADTATLPGAHNSWQLTAEHGFSIWWALRISGQITRFLTAA